MVQCQVILVAVFAVCRLSSRQFDWRWHVCKLHVANTRAMRVQGSLPLSFLVVVAQLKPCCRKQQKSPLADYLERQPFFAAGLWDAGFVLQQACCRMLCGTATEHDRPTHQPLLLPWLLLVSSDPAIRKVDSWAGGQCAYGNAAFKISVSADLWDLLHFKRTDINSTAMRQLVSVGDGCSSPLGSQSALAAY